MTCPGCAHKIQLTISNGHFPQWMLTTQDLPCGCIQYDGLKLSAAGNILHLLHQHGRTWTKEMIQEWLDEVAPEAHEEAQQILSCYADIEMY